MTRFFTHFSINHLEEIGHNFFFFFKKKKKIQDIKQIKQYIKLQEVKYIYQWACDFKYKDQLQLETGTKDICK